MLENFSVVTGHSVTIYVTPKKHGVREVSLHIHEYSDENHHFVFYQFSLHVSPSAIQQAMAVKHRVEMTYSVSVRYQTPSLCTTFKCIYNLICHFMANMCHIKYITACAAAGFVFVQT